MSWKQADLCKIEKIGIDYKGRFVCIRNTNNIESCKKGKCKHFRKESIGVIKTQKTLEEYLKNDD